MMSRRRVFLKNGAFALVSLGFAPSFLARTALAVGDPPAEAARSPSSSAAPWTASASSCRYGEADYYRARPSDRDPAAGTAATRAIDLDGFFGFNPRLQPLKPLWDSRRLAIVHACGSPDSTRSHFDAQDYMETATPGVKSTATAG